MGRRAEPADEGGGVRRARAAHLVAACLHCEQRLQLRRSLGITHVWRLDHHVGRNGEREPDGRVGMISRHAGGLAVLPLELCGLVWARCARRIVQYARHSPFARLLARRVVNAKLAAQGGEVGLQITQIHWVNEFDAHDLLGGIKQLRRCCAVPTHRYRKVASFVERELEKLVVERERLL